MFMCQLIKEYVFGDMKATYILNDNNRAVLLLLPKNNNCDLFSEKNMEVYNDSSLVHLKLANHNVGMLSNSMKFSDTVFCLKYVEQRLLEEENSITIITKEEADDNYGICHYLKWYKGDLGFEVSTEFYNNTDKELEIEFLTSASLDALSPFLPNEGSNQLSLHYFKAGWSMEGLHKEYTFQELGLERAWARSAESLKFGAIGSRPIREYHPYGAIEDKTNGVIWGMYLAHNASWQMEVTRLLNGVSLSIGLSDSQTADWTRVVKPNDSFKTPVAMISVTKGSIAELSNRILSMRNKYIDLLGENELPIIYNDFVTSWGKPNEEDLLETANILSNGKTKYFVMDAGWYYPYRAIGDWNIDTKAFPNGMKAYTEKIKSLGMIPGIWMEFECADSHAETFSEKYDYNKLKYKNEAIVGNVINGRKEKFFDFSNQEVINYLDEKVINFLKENGFGYLKVDYNASIGIGPDGEYSRGENLRIHMEKVREYFKKIRREVPGIIIENCASGGCRLEPSMMDITEMSSASDTHEGYEAAVVAANLHYLTPPRQNQIWCTLKPEYSKERFSFIIAQGFLGRLCWSGKINELSDLQLDELFSAEKYYEDVAAIIKNGNSYIFRTQPCSFYSPIGTQVVVRYSDDEETALVVVHGFNSPDKINISLNDKYTIASSLYENDFTIHENVLNIANIKELSGNVILLKKQ